VTSALSAQPRKPANKSFPASPLNLYHRVYCRSCPEADFCKACFEQHLLCLLAKLADDLAKIRQVITIRERWSTAEITLNSEQQKTVAAKPRRVRLCGE